MSLPPPPGTVQVASVAIRNELNQFFALYRQEAPLDYVECNRAEVPRGARVERYKPGHPDIAIFKKPDWNDKLNERHAQRRQIAGRPHGLGLSYRLYNEESEVEFAPLE